MRVPIVGLFVSILPISLVIYIFGSPSAAFSSLLFFGFISLLVLSLIWALNAESGRSREIREGGTARGRALRSAAGLVLRIACAIFAVACAICALGCLAMLGYDLYVTIAVMRFSANVLSSAAMAIFGLTGLFWGVCGFFLTWAFIRRGHGHMTPPTLANTGQG